MADKKNSYSFEKGLGYIPMMYQTAIRSEIMKILHINNGVSWISYKKGRMRIEHDNYIAIEHTFAKYGVDKKNVWGLIQ
jgi:hypothetical protein